ncbi:hypothetical protein ACHAXR_010080 [Thalassiosira sp. AJA248-18]
MINTALITTLSCATLVSSVAERLGKKGRMGHGGMGHGGMWRGGSGGGTGSKRDMMDVIHDLFDSVDDDDITNDIKRTVNNTDTGIESYTYSDDEDVASWIQTHVYQMTSLMDSESGGIRLWDDLFHNMFELRDFHKLEVTNTTKGVYAVQNVAKDVEDADEKECTKSLIQAHAELVSLFVERGRREMRNNHRAPTECKGV